MKLGDLKTTELNAIGRHAQGIMALAGASAVLTLTADNPDQMRDECQRHMFETYGLDYYNPKTHRPVAIMASDREPSDAAKAIDDATAGNPNASRVLDAVAEAFGRLTDGDHVQLDIHIDNDRVSIEHWSPPARKETPLEPWDGSPVKPGEKISPTTATDIPAQQALEFAVGQKVFVVYGDQQAGPARITAYSVYEKTGTQYLAEWITPEGTPKSIWSTADAFRPAQVEHSSFATDHQRV